MLEQSLLEDAMRRALRISLRGPADNPNPQVGCVILAPDGRIIAEGWHRGSGTPHAEVDAIAHLAPEWLARAAELTAVVTLEPCNHTGRTGPCAIALRDAGFGAVAYALSDPGDSSSGGAQTLAAAGVELRSGVLAAEARTILAPWFARQAAAASALAAATPSATPAPSPRPRVIAKWAQTLDGRAAAADGSSQWITGPIARADVHRRRAAADAILVGTGTLLADNPSLTARTPAGELLVPPAQQPVPVVLGRRAIPEAAAINTHPALAATDRSTPIHLTGVDLVADLEHLHRAGIRSVFVEGGPAIISALLAAGLVDELLVYVAPALLGGPRLAIGDLGITSMAGIVRPRITSVTALGDDYLMTASLTATEEG